MESIFDLYTSIERYFSTLRKTGYKRYEEVRKLLIFIFIHELLYGSMNVYINDMDYKDISKALECLYGSCLIPFPNYRQGIEGIYKDLPDEYRISEISILRNTETGDLRVKS